MIKTKTTTNRKRVNKTAPIPPPPAPAPIPPTIHAPIKQILRNFYDAGHIPNILFHGSSGCGKRTLIYDFLHMIYKKDIETIRQNVMFVNCAHGKGIKFIREDLKFFAKSNLCSARADIPFKSIVLFNAEKLTEDAQSALRRCIEQFSHNTRFFMVVEREHNLLYPIISRFAKIYVPEIMDETTGNFINLHQYELHKIVAEKQLTKQRQIILYRIMGALPRPPITHIDILNCVDTLYENGFSSLDVVEWMANTEHCDKHKHIMTYYKIKSEYRCEKLLMMYMLDLFFM